MIEKNQDRRSRDRFQLEMKGVCRWPIDKRSASLSAGVRTCNVSSKGLLIYFTGENMPPFGAMVSIELAWPVLLDGRVKLKFVATGRVTRVADPLVAATLSTHKFATVANGNLLEMIKVA